MTLDIELFTGIIVGKGDNCECENRITLCECELMSTISTDSTCWAKQ